ncbi:MAG: Calcineurin-like phosphoesterase superfamily domain protein [Methanomassiliicoccales archaeon PtaU1.Bin124]|nr:MAG: Calcineurin-like phosphoesterase superfamily domain protein [Methanomassiliicoccales archaeon PtaU1.Bin124]
MRFLVLSDVHMRDKVGTWAARLAGDHAVDGILVLGDITHFGPPEWAGEFLRSLPGKVYAIPGNCDPLLTLTHIERSSICLHQRRIRLADRDWIGYGGSNPTIFKTPNEVPEERIFQTLDQLMTPGAVMMMHCPAMGILDLTTSGVRGGSEAIKQIVDKYHPSVLLSGHIHEARGCLRERGTLFLNPGAAKDGYAALLEIDAERAEATLLDRVVD